MDDKTRAKILTDAVYSGDLDTLDIYKEYDEMLDESYSFESVGGSFRYLRPSKVLEENCPTDYRCGFADWTDSESHRIEEVDGDYVDRDKADAIIEAYEDELEAKLEADEAANDLDTLTE